MCYSVYPSANAEWTEVRNRIQAGENVYVQERATVFVAYKDDKPWAVIFWGSQDSGQAQRWCRRAAKGRP